MSQTLSSLPAQLPAHLERCLAADIACNLYSGEDIGNRYDLGGEPGLKAYLRTRPKLVAHIQQLRAINDSALGADDRLKLKNTLAAEAVVHHMARLVADPNTTPAQKVDAYDKLLKGSGVTIPPRVAQNNGLPSGAQATPFSFTINIIGKRPETITITGVPTETPIPDPPPSLPDLDPIQDLPAPYVDPSPVLDEPTMPVAPVELVRQPPEQFVHVPNIGQRALAAFYQGTAKVVATS